MTAHIGIVACSAEGASLCYRTICQEGPAVLGPHAHPEVTMHTPSLATYMEPIGRGDWRAVGEVMLRSAGTLARAGAEVLICPDNTIHQGLDLVAGRAPLPWLHIGEVVAAEAAGRGYRRVGITGTRWLVESEVYPATLGARGLDWVRPDADARETMNRLIIDDLTYGVFKPETVAFFQSVIGGLKERGCDAVVLGCTEIPLIVDETNSPLPVLDSTRLLARAALRWAIAAERRPAAAAAG